jgi:tripartite-type tricarboxylate transporter receptor subunit TctC
MKFNRPTPARRLAFTLGTLVMTAMPLFANAQTTWPSKPLTLVIPFPPGNTADLVARTLQEPLRKALGQPVIVDNKPGAGGNIAAQAVARADKDGHTLLVTTGSPLVLNPAVYKRLPFDAEKDFAPVAIVGSIPMVLIARNDLPVSSLAELLTYARANESKVTYASVGQGTFTHLGMELFAKAVGLKLTHVPYKGASPAHADLIGGRIDFMFDSLASSNIMLKAGRVKALAVTAAKRTPFLMDVPTVVEASAGKLTDFDVTVWTGLFAPAGTPPDAVRRLNEEITKLLRSPDFRAQLAAQFIRADDPLTPAQFTQRVKADRDRWSSVARGINLELQ